MKKQLFKMTLLWVALLLPVSKANGETWLQNEKECSTKGLCAESSGVARGKVNVKRLGKAPAIRVVYTGSYKGEQQPGETWMTVCGSQAKLQRVDTAAHNQRRPTTYRYLDYDSCRYYQYAELPDGRCISTSVPFKLGQGFEVLREEEYFGLPCQVLKTIINSNTIEVWVTKALPFRGTPQHVGIADGLVLRIVRNGDQVQEVKEIVPLKEAQSILPGTWGSAVDAPTYSYMLNQSVVTTVPIFDNDSLRFSGAKLPDTLQEGIVYSAAGGTVILKKVSLPKVEEGSGVFAEVMQYSAGDAYDRTGSVFLIPTDRAQSFLDALRDLKSVPAFTSNGVDYHALVTTSDYLAPLELMRFFTGFGVRQYNYITVPGQQWVDSVLYKQDISAFRERLQGEVWIGAYIGNWDGNGHRLSLRLKYYPEGSHESNRTILPLFNTVNYVEQAGQPYPVFMRGDSLVVRFTLQDSAKNARLVYLTTGHGGWGGGDEFNPKPNSIYLDGEKVITFIPWRDDCATYRNNNPCSGNFENGQSSSDLSRSNWCPGTVTNPEYIPLGDLAPGEHTLYVKIPQGAPEGGSNSYWCISGTLVY